MLTTGFYALASFYRLFYGFTGYSAKEYIRMRRLNYAALRLLVTDYPTVEIALDAGFENQESFTKAFKAAVGVTPGRYRNRKNLIRYSFERINLMDKQFFAADGKLAEAYPDAKIMPRFTRTGGSLLGLLRRAGRKFLQLHRSLGEEARIGWAGEGLQVVR